MIELFTAMIDAIRRQPDLLLSGAQLVVILSLIMLLLPRRWQLMIGFAALVLLAAALIGRMP